jgi:DNA adenine methylase
MARHDRPGTLFYLDPPYDGGKTNYGAGLFDRAEYERMAAVLMSLKGRFILSINDVPQIRPTFEGFTLKPVRLSYTISGNTNSKAARELIITKRSQR